MQDNQGNHREPHKGWSVCAASQLFFSHRSQPFCSSLVRGYSHPALPSSLFFSFFLQLKLALQRSKESNYNNSLNLLQ